MVKIIDFNSEIIKYENFLLSRELNKKEKKILDKLFEWEENDIKNNWK